MTHWTHEEDHSGTARGLHHLIGRLRGPGGLARMAGDWKDPSISPGSTGSRTRRDLRPDL